MSWWDGYQERPDRINVTVVESEPPDEPRIVLPNGKTLVPGKPSLGFDPKRTQR